jgi:hypothetical protein
LSPCPCPLTIARIKKRIVKNGFYILENSLDTR